MGRGDGRLVGLAQAHGTHTHSEDRESRVSERARWVKVLAAKPDALSLSPRTQVVEGEIRLSQVVL